MPGYEGEEAVTRHILTAGQREALATVQAARSSRRSILQAATALGAVGALAPLYARKALSSSGR